MMSVIVIDVGWLEHLAAVAGAKVEVDQDGGVAVSPASDQHVIAATRLAIQLAGQLPQDLEVLVEGPRWSPLGALTPSYVPDLAVIARSALDRVDGDYQLDPPPLLIVEILSPATRRRDLGEKLDNYYFGGARIYWTIGVPGLSDANQPQVTIHRRGPDGWESTGPARSGEVTWPPGMMFETHLAIDFDRLAV